MAFFNFRKQSNRSNTKLKTVSESLINPLYKPKTLSELKAIMSHTGINPAPVPLRSPLPVVDGVDEMDAPPVITGGDVFENIRNSRMYYDRLEDLESSVKPDPKPKTVPELSDGQSD